MASVDQIEKEVSRALRDSRLKEHQRRSVAAVVLMAKCSVEEALAGIHSWVNYKPEWSRAWATGAPDSGCTGYIEHYAMQEAFDSKAKGKSPVTSLADYRKAKERRDG